MSISCTLGGRPPRLPTRDSHLPCSRGEHVGSQESSSGLRRRRADLCGRAVRFVHVRACSCMAARTAFPGLFRAPAPRSAGNHWTPTRLRSAAQDKKSARLSPRARSLRAYCARRRGSRKRHDAAPRPAMSRQMGFWRRGGRTVIAPGASERVRAPAKRYF